MRIVLAGMLASLLLAAPAQMMPDGLRRNPVQQIGLAPSADANEWLLAAAEHEPGTLDEPAKRIAAWPAAKLTRALGAIRDLRPSTALHAALARGAMLHADLWLLTEQDLPAAPGTAWDDVGVITLLKDGRPVGTGGLVGHIAFGRQVIRAMRRNRAVTTIDPRVRQWYRALTAEFASRLWMSDLLPHLRAARDLFPEDPGILFDSGCMAEAMASPPLQAGVPNPSSIEWSKMSELQRRTLSAAFNLRAAERHYRAALERDPSLVEARIRLARVLAVRGEAGAAADLLVAAGESDDAFVRYYHAVILGDVEERRGRLAAAVEAYRRASTLFPGAQTPFIVIARLERERGDSEAARAALAALAALPAHEQQRLDPWWSYWMCNGRNFTDELRELRRQFRTRDAP